ncbi:hypothetical protein TrispH2_009844 [Trichoplax sp. H2]|nr:hypothetical protein TrispH2_009844 [Trichoplax sp. H2]|eukprot:RDD38229.1 hypothetical protein TrispH2_009844 [Trichoplax sp. H2]
MKLSCYVIVTLSLVALCLLAEARNVKDRRNYRLSYYYRQKLNRRQPLSLCALDAACTTNKAIVCTKNSDCCCTGNGGAEECVLYVGGNCLYVENHADISSGTCMVPIAC